MLRKSLPTSYSRSPASHHHLEIGSQVGRYSVVALINVDEQGEIYRVRHQTLQSNYALKLFQGDRSGSDELHIEEPRFQAPLDHPAFVRIHDLLEVHGTPAILMDYIAGESLQEHLRREPLSREEEEEIYSQLEEALDFARQEGISLQALKPSQILLAKDQGKLRIKILGARVEGEGLSERSSPGEERSLGALLLGEDPFLPTKPRRTSRRRVLYGSLLFAIALVLAGSLGWSHLRSPVKRATPTLDVAELEEQGREEFHQGDPFRALMMLRAAKAMNAESTELQELLNLVEQALPENLAVYHHRAPEALRALAYSPDGRRLAMGAATGVVVLLDMETGEEQARFVSNLSGGIGALFFTPDADRLVLLPGIYQGENEGPAPARVVDAQSGKVLHSLSHGERTRAVKLNADGTLGATLGEDDKILLWNLETGAPRATLTNSGERAPVLCMDYSPLEDLIVAGHILDEEQAWLSIYEPQGRDRRRWEEVRLPFPKSLLGQSKSPTRPHDQACQLRFSPDGNLLIANLGGVILVIERATWDIAGSRKTSTNSLLALAEDGHALIHEDGHDRLVLRSLPDLEEIAILQSAGGPFRSALFWHLPEAEARVVAVDSSGLLQVYSASTGEELALVAHPSPWVAQVPLKVSGQGQALVVASKDGEVRTFQRRDVSRPREEITNIRICPANGAAIAQIPYPQGQQIWAPEDLCEEEELRPLN